MAPRTPTIAQSEALINQIMTLVRGSDYKALEALYDVYIRRQAEYTDMARNAEEHNELPEYHEAEANTAYYQAQVVRMIYNFKKHHQTLYNEHFRIENK